MKPYYESKGITIYCGDAREVLPQLERVDLVLTDPPYVGLAGGVSLSTKGCVNAPQRNATKTVGDLWGADLEWLPEAWALAHMGMLVFTSFHALAEVRARLPEAKAKALLVWQKKNAPWPVHNAPRMDCEFIWAFAKDAGLNWRVFRSMVLEVPKLSTGCMRSKEKVDHPTQKPLGLMRLLLGVGGDSVLDPFAGSGTTLLAAQELGRKAVGIEINEEYCELAVKRLAQEVLFGQP